MYAAFGVRGATYFLGFSERLFGALLLAGFWNKKLGILGALGSCGRFIATSTIIPFFSDGWAASAGGLGWVYWGSVPTLCLLEAARSVRKHWLFKEFQAF